MEKVSVIEKYPDYQIDIGIEVHVQLNTKSKIFCSCSNAQTTDQNSHICPICCGYPGVLPVLNKEVVDHAIKLGLATQCTIAPQSTFARKHYFYPDLPKGYQISQNDNPICTEGYIPIRLNNGTEKNIRLVRIHMEEDAGKNLHATDTESFVDLNRAGTPLLEIVSYPDIKSTQEVRIYLKALRAIVVYLGISTANMEEGSFRADTNISVRKKNSQRLGTRCELKNINSFKFISDAVEHEIERQIILLESGESVHQETRLWDTHKKITRPMRSKEEAADYRYFEEPDLPIVEVNQEWIERIRSYIPELPYEKFKRFCSEYGLLPYEANILVYDCNLAQYFEDAQKHTQSKLLINWILRDLMAYLKEKKVCLNACKVTAPKLAALVNLVEQGIINTHAAQEIFANMSQTGNNPQDIIKEKGLEQITDANELEKIVQEVIKTNPNQVKAYQSGKDRLFSFFVGKAMQKTQGKGDPKIISSLLKKILK